MATSSTMDIVPFGRDLIESGDLDPVYVALAGWDVPPDQLKRFLVAYWCLYHCGVACFLSEFKSEQFWRKLNDAAHNDQPPPVSGLPEGTRWPRGAERRHWRGGQAIKSANELAGRYQAPEHMVDYIAGTLDASDSRTAEGPLQPFEVVAGRAKEHRGFGDWISFKVCDMLERVLSVPVDFSESAVFMFKDPALAADMAWERYVGPVKGAKFDTIERRHRIVEHLNKAFSDLKAPPRHDRPINIQETETCLCKWKSHVNGHYPLGKDTREILEGLHGWGEAAQGFGEAMKDLKYA